MYECIFSKLIYMYNIDIFLTSKERRVANFCVCENDYWFNNKMSIIIFIDSTFANYTSICNLLFPEYFFNIVLKSTLRLAFSHSDSLLFFFVYLVLLLRLSIFSIPSIHCFAFLFNFSTIFFFFFCGWEAKDHIPFKHRVMLFHTVLQKLSQV